MIREWFCIDGKSFQYRQNISSLVVTKTSNLNGEILVNCDMNYTLLNLGDNARTRFIIPINIERLYRSCSILCSMQYLYDFVIKSFTFGGRTIYNFSVFENFEDIDFSDNYLFYEFSRFIVFQDIFPISITELHLNIVFPGMKSSVIGNRNLHFNYIPIDSEISVSLLSMVSFSFSFLGFKPITRYSPSMTQVTDQSNVLFSYFCDIEQISNEIGDWNFSFSWSYDFAPEWVYWFSIIHLFVFAPILVGILLSIIFFLLKKILRVILWSPIVTRKPNRYPTSQSYFTKNKFFFPLFCVICILSTFFLLMYFLGTFIVIIWVLQTHFCVQGYWALKT